MNATPWNKALHFVPVFDEVSMPTSKHRIAVNFPGDEYAELAGLADKHYRLAIADLAGRMKIRES